MKLTRLPNLLPGERPLAVAPELAPAVDARWQRRTNLYAGRTLTAPTLRGEQTHRAARLTLTGQALSAGVVRGLECGIETELRGSGEARTEVGYLRIEPGLGLAGSGEQVALDKAVRIELLDLPVYTTPDIFARAEGREPAPPAESTGALSARRAGAPLRALQAPAVGLPRAGVLVLQPTWVEAIGEFDPDDPCERDPQNEAFEDQLEIDSLRLLYYAWPTEWLPLPAADAQWRNRLAHAVFEAQRVSGALPWDEVGVPIALIGFDADWRALFVDRAAVVRAGGKPRAHSGVFAARGNAFLWQARIEQLSEHATEFVAEQAQRPKPPGIDDAVWRARLLDEVAAQFRYLPPVGLLPREVAEPRSRTQSFFPARFTVDAVPIPLEQLDVAIEASAALAGYDTFASDGVRMLVPVPQQWYEPRLLQTEEVPAEFAAKLGELVAVRGQWLQRRADVRAKSSALAQALTGKPSEFPTPDPGALEAEELPNTLPDPAEDAYGTETAGTGIRVSELEALKAKLRAGSPINGVARETLAVAPTFPDNLGALRARIGHDPASRRLSFSGVMSSAERDSLLALSNDTEYRGAIGRLHVRSQDDELAQLEARGLEGFITLLEQKIARSDDLIDLGFLRVQTDLYRTRQLVLGSKAASRLAVSPALAGFAKSQSAVATQQQLEKFYEGLRGRPITPPPSGGPIGGGVRAPTTGGPSAPAGSAPRAGFGNATLAAGGPSLFADSLRLDAGIDKRTIAIDGSQFSGASERVAADSGSRLLPEALQQSAFDQVIGQQALVGKALLRSSTIAERMESPQAPEAKNSAAATKHEVVRMLAGLPISTDGLTAVGVSAAPDQAADRALPARGAALHLNDFARPELLGQLLAEPDPKTQDESLFFAAGVELADQSIAALRGVEGRIAQYRSALELCRAALAKIKASAAAAGLRLQAIERELAEARHDVGVARVLLAEETARVANVNARRDEILREHVKFFAYQRPRTADNLRAAPLRPLAPGLTVSPVPACLRDHGDGPHELRALLEVLREAPLTWFSQLRGHLFRLDRLDVLMETARNAQLRAARHVGVALDEFPERGGPVGGAVKTVVAAQQRMIVERRSAFAGLDVAALASASWQIAQTQLAAHLSIADLLDNPSRRSDLAREVAEEVERIGKVAACLHARFAEAPPFLRLLWVEQFSQYDGPVNLRNLAALPRFHELDVLDRRDLQQLVDWLFGRVDPNQAQAVGLINDLVRLAILLASHAPVNEIVAGRVRVPGRVRPGHRIELAAFDPARVRIGMQVLLYDENRVAARAVVEDLSATQVAARVVESDANGIDLKTETRVQFTEARALGFAFRG